jgi:hypothetical protein
MSDYLHDQVENASIMFESAFDVLIDMIEDHHHDAVLEVLSRVDAQTKLLQSLYTDSNDEDKLNAYRRRL